MQCMGFHGTLLKFMYFLQYKLERSIRAVLQLPGLQWCSPGREFETSVLFNSY